MNTLGIYGKLPTHGDFIQRNLSTSFISEWDKWLQNFISGTKEQIGVDWLDIYLTSPIWRFVLSHGVVDEYSWAGILMPSVDQVGRYFPFTVALRLAQYINPLEFFATQIAWYDVLEEISLSALDGEYDIDELVEEISRHTPNTDPAYHPGNGMLESFSVHFDLDFEEQSASVVYPYMLDVMLNKVLNSYSVWSTAGSERVSPSIFTVKNLPPVSKLPAMLDGEWARWGWQKPYALDTTQINTPNIMPAS